MQANAGSPVWITTYNLLAPCTIGSVLSDDPVHLQFEHRWPLILRDLAHFMELGHILVLQEVDAEIERNGLYKFLVSSDYYCVFGLRVEPRHHATVIAFPRTRYLVLQTSYERIGHLIAPPPVHGDGFWRLFDEAQKRNYLMPWVLLFDRETGRQFYVFGYHMPCVFQRPPVMSLQLEAVMRKIAELTRKTPFILAGDFNFQPDSALYEFATTARCPEAIRPYPAFSLWSSSCRQGLVDHLGKKSKLVTNKTPGFQGRIDYIWTSANWRLVEFRCDRLKESIPNRDHGSDHVPLSFCLEIKTVARSGCSRLGSRVGNKFKVNFFNLLFFGPDFKKTLTSPCDVRPLAPTKPRDAAAQSAL